MPDEIGKPRKRLSVDGAFEALLSDPRNFVRPPPAHVSMERVRTAAKQGMVTLAGPEMDRVESCLDGKVRLYTPVRALDDAAILYFHGGGFVLGDLDTHDGICRRLSVAAGMTLAAVDYRLAPEAPHPGAVEDACEAVGWLLRDRELTPSRLALAGDSAGAYIGMSAALRMPGRIAYLVLAYPILDPSCSTETAERYGEAYLLTRDAMRWFWRCYLQDQPDPLAHADFSRLPPTTIVTAGFDPLRGEAEALAERMRSSGVPVTERLYPRMIHGFLGMPHLTSCAQEAIVAMAGDIRAAID